MVAIFETGNAEVLNDGIILFIDSLFSLVEYDSLVGIASFEAPVLLITELGLTFKDFVVRLGGFRPVLVVIDLVTLGLPA